MDELVHLERKIQSIYGQALLPLAQRVAFDLPVTQRDAPGRPSVLFLGNHSSGKSSFINDLIGLPIQKTGLAPTDDGFTLITFGEQRDEFDGQTVVTHPELPYRVLERHGAVFLSRLRLKTVPHELLKTVTLIDSPGMIDAAREGNTRGYDFPAVVREFAESADLILFFFDPHKPGTTGEAITIFTETLTGLEHKLLIVMNKVDLFANVRDFARTYGTLCWNLSKAIRTKDIPHIYNIFVPQTDEKGPGEASALPLHDFELSRDEVLAEIRRTPSRRADNLVSDLHNQGRRLSVHAHVCRELAREWLFRRNQVVGATASVLLLTALIAWLVWDAAAMGTAAWVAVIGLVLGTGVFFGGREWLRDRWRRASSPSGLDALFEKVYRHELALHDRADLRDLWQGVKPHTASVVKALGPKAMAAASSIKRLLKQLEKVIEQDVPQLRRSISEEHARLQKIGSSAVEG
jgi:hypothetical protein